MLANSQAKAYTLILFLISPVLGLILGLKNLDRKGKHLLLTLFGLFYGLVLNYSDGADASRYIQLVETYYTLGLTDFWDRLVDIINLRPGYGVPKDLYIHFLCGIAGSIFSSSTLLFVLVGTVYGYFYGNALLNVINWSESRVKKISILAFALILLFVIHRSFGSMQTIRSWTGMWVLFNGVFGYHQTQKKRYLLLIMSTPFFHIMYGFIVVPVLLAIVFKFLPRHIFIGVYVVSFIVNVNTLVIVDAASGNDFTKTRLAGYYRIDETGNGVDPTAERLKRSNAVWYAKLGKTTSVYTGATAFLLFILIGGYYNKRIMNSVEYGLMTTALLMASLANLLSFALAFYSRTMANATIYILAVVVLLMLKGVFDNKPNAWLKKIGLWVGVIIYIPKILFFASEFMYETSVMLFAMPLLHFFDAGFNASIRDLINLFI